MLPEPSFVWPYSKALSLFGSGYGFPISFKILGNIQLHLSRPKSEETLLPVGIRGGSGHVWSRHFVGLVGESKVFEISYTKVF
jgi:NO-binding membrane sensor protein with MHYT domain